MAQFSLGDIRENVFTVTKVFAFPSPVSGQNTHVIEWFRSVPVILEKNDDWSVKKWGDPRIVPCKVFCTLPKGTKLTEIEYVESNFIRPKS